MVLIFVPVYYRYFHVNLQQSLFIFPSWSIGHSSNIVY